MKCCTIFNWNKPNHVVFNFRLIDLELRVIYERKNELKVARKKIQWLEQNLDVVVVAVCCCWQLHIIFNVRPKEINLLIKELTLL